MNTISIVPLTEKFAISHEAHLNLLRSLIPDVTPHPENLLKLSDANRVYHAKWRHSFVALDGDKPVGILIAYERNIDKHYPNPTLYIAEIAIEESYRNHKIGSELIQKVIYQAKQHEFYELLGIKTLSVQTNNEEKNRNVQAFYEKFGFVQIGMKSYDNRTDRIYSLKID